MSKDLETRLMTLEQANTALAERVATLEGARPGRKALPILVSIDGICGVDPARDSATCADASLYRRQKGCQGAACKALSAQYYRDYRKAQGVTKNAPKQQPVKKRRRRRPAA